MKNQVIITLLLSILLFSCQTEIESTSSAVNNTEKDSIVEESEIIHPDANISSLNQIDSSIHEDLSREIATLEIPDTLVLNDSLYFLVDTIAVNDYERVSYLRKELDYIKENCQEFITENQDYFSVRGYSIYDMLWPCSKEIEQLKLKKFSNIESIPYGLKISLSNGDTLTYDGFVPSMPDRSGGYIFFDYIKPTNDYLIQVLAFESCFGFMLVNKHNGEELYWEGRPYFSNKKEKLVLVGENSSYCKRILSYWELEEEEFKKIATYEMKDWYFVNDLKWIDHSSFVGKIRFDDPYNQGDESKYLKIKIIASK